MKGRGGRKRANDFHRARLAKIKQHQAKSLSKSAKSLGREWFPLFLFLFPT